MKTRVLVGVICLPILFAILFWAPPIFFTILVALICAISAIELIQAAGMPKNLRVRIYVILSAILIPFIVHQSYQWGFSSIVFGISRWTMHTLLIASWDMFWVISLPSVAPLILIFLIFFEAAIAYKTERQITFNQVLAALFGATLMPHMLSSLVSIRLIYDAGRYMLLIPIICAFFTDAGAYFSGYLFGKRKAFPHISPKKTVAGCVGGLITGALMLVLFGTVINLATHHPADLILLALIGIVGAAFTQLGDLAFSFIKREYNVKDFGKLIPGHGGMLDRFDSLFFAAPVIYLMLTTLPAMTLNIQR